MLIQTVFGGGAVAGRTGLLVLNVASLPSSSWRHANPVSGLLHFHETGKIEVYNLISVNHGFTQTHFYLVMDVGF